MSAASTTYAAPSYTAEIDEPVPETPCECGSCDWTGPFSELLPIEDCSLTPGDPSPAGRCPDLDCNSLAYPVVQEPEQKQEDDSYPPPCSNPGGHVWNHPEEHEATRCVHCGADGDA